MIEHVHSCDPANGDEARQQYRKEREIGEDGGPRGVVGGTREIDVVRLHPASDEVYRDGRIETEKGVGRVHEAFLLVRLGGEDREPDVERSEPGRQQDIRRRLARFRRDLVLAETPVVVFVSDGQSGQGNQGKRGEVVEVECEVQEIVVPRFRAVEFRTAARREDVVCDNIERRENEAAVGPGVDQNCNDLPLAHDVYGRAVLTGMRDAHRAPLMSVCQRFASNFVRSPPSAISPPLRYTCSTTNGIARAALKGQPSTAPSAYKTYALMARRCPCGSDEAGWSQNDVASIVVYMAKDDGRKAAL